MNKATLKLAKAISDDLLAGYNEYLEECDSFRKDGYRPSHCEHGTNNWTDYDNICGPCEDGMTMGDAMQRREFALDSAKRRTAKVSDIAIAVSNLRELGVDIDMAPVYKRITSLLTP